MFWPVEYMTRRNRYIFINNLRTQDESTLPFSLVVLKCLGSPSYGWQLYVCSLWIWMLRYPWTLLQVYQCRSATIVPYRGAIHQDQYHKRIVSKLFDRAKCRIMANNFNSWMVPIVMWSIWVENFKLSLIIYMS